MPFTINDRSGKRTKSVASEGIAPRPEPPSGPERRIAHRRHCSGRTKKGEYRQAAFTLIELLIVVAIIAILAAIALPNFLEAQTRAKVSRAKSDLRTIAVAVEAYAADNRSYPYPLNPYKESLSIVHELSTPVAYLTSTDVLDPFHPKFEDLNPPPPPSYKPTYWYNSFSGYFGERTNAALGVPMFSGYCLSSVGPDLESNSVAILPMCIGANAAMTRNTVSFLCDPTNGTVSKGDIARWAGKPEQP